MNVKASTRSFAAACLFAGSAALSSLYAQPPGPGLGGPPQRGGETKFESHVVVRGDREILTFETEEQFRALEMLYEQNRNTTPAPGEFGMQYFRARTDNSVQPFGLWIPRDYSPNKKYALLIQLHGISPESAGGRRQTWQGQGTKEWIDTNLPIIVAHPFGHLNSFYQGIGEEEVLQVIDEVQRKLSVDSDRVFIMGHSMGGAGSFTVGLHHPDRFGSITPIDAAMWSPEDGESALPEWALPQAAVVRPPSLYSNARNIPVFFKNAGAGIQRTSTKFSDGIVAAGGFATMESFPGMPHHFAPQMSYSMFSGEATLQPINRHPTEVKFSTTTLRYDRAYWLTIDRLSQHNRESSVTATFDDGKTPTPFRRPGSPPAPPPPARPPSLKIATGNIASLTLRLSDLPPQADANMPLPVNIDGVEVFNGRAPAVMHLSRASGVWAQVDAAASASAGKRHGMQGPLGDAFNDRFLAVYGDASDRELAIAELDAVRNPPGGLILHGDFPMKAAVKLTADDVASSNLILFGTPATNPVLQRLAPRLPKRVMDEAEAGGGLVFIYPNPENPERYVVVWTTKLLSLPDVAPKLGFVQPVNLLPDYAVVKNGKISDAGYFDGDWK